MSTVTIPPVLPSPRDDAKQLHRAFKGLGCDTAAVMNIIAHRDASQLARIQQEYETLFSDDLNKRLSSELHGHVKKAVLLWMDDPVSRDATIVRHSLHGTVTYDKGATEVICSRTPSQLRKIKQIYLTNFGTHLERDIEIHTSGEHKKLLLAYVHTTRYEGPEIDQVLVENDAKALHKGGPKKPEDIEKTLIRIFSERSSAHLAAVSYAYTVAYGKPLGMLIKKETSGDFGHALLTILQCTENPAKYFVKALRKAMKGLGTHDTALIRIIVTRAEVDMQFIKAEYRRKYGKTLNDVVHSETSGHYKSFLLSLLGPNY